MSSKVVITEDALSNFQHAFYSSMGDGKITLDKLTELAEGVVGPNVIPEARLKAIVQKLQPKQENKSFDFPKMLRMLADEAATLISISKEDLLIALSAFEEMDGFKRTGHITSKEVANVLRTYGEGLPEDEIRDIVKRIDTESSGRIPLEDVADMILNE